MIIVFLAGFCTLGIQMGINAVSAILYPTALRSTGSGWAFGIGRVGSIVGPIVGGLLIATMTVQQLYLIAAIPFLLGAIVCLILARMFAKRRGN
jgi:AAHS family 4-hydroxybenzoate transporter-like MFS transporter